MQLTKFELPYPAPKTEEEELANLISVLAYDFSLTPYIKSNPLRSLWKEGNMNVEYVIREAELVAQRKSGLSRSKREAVTGLVAAAAINFRNRQKDNDSDSKTNDSGGQG